MWKRIARRARRGRWTRNCTRSCAGTAGTEIRQRGRSRGKRDGTEHTSENFRADVSDWGGAGRGVRAATGGLRGRKDDGYRGKYFGGRYSEDCGAGGAIDCG